MGLPVTGDNHINHLVNYYMSKEHVGFLVWEL